MLEHGQTMEYTRGAKTVALAQLNHRMAGRHPLRQLVREVWIPAGKVVWGISQALVSKSSRLKVKCTEVKDGLCVLPRQPMDARLVF